MILGIEEVTHIGEKVRIDGPRLNKAPGRVASQITVWLGWQAESGHIPIVFLGGKGLVFFFPANFPMELNLPAGNVV